MALIEKDGVFVEDDPGDATKLLAKKLAVTDSPAGFACGNAAPASPKEYSHIIQDTAEYEYFRYHMGLGTGGVTGNAPAFITHRLQLHRFYAPFDSLSVMVPGSVGSAASTGTATFTATPPANGQVLTIGARSYTFVTGVPGTNEISVDGSPTAAQMATRVRYAIMGNVGAAGSATGFGAFTVPHDKVSCTNGTETAPTAVVTFLCYRPGRSGDSLAFAKSGTAGSEWSISGSGTLTGGGAAGFVAADNTAGVGTVQNYYFVDGDRTCDGTKVGYFDQFKRRLIAWTFASPTDPGGALTLTLRNQATNILSLSITGNNAQGDPNWRGRSVVSASGGGDVIPANAYLQGFIANNSGAVAPPRGAIWSLYFAREF